MAWADDSGSCGNGVTYTYVASTHTLTISGNGSIKSYDYQYGSPWHNYGSVIQTLIIEKGVTSIGNYAFDDCNGLTKATIPSTVTSIKQGAFRSCSSLTGITLPSSIISIGEYAFSGCSGLTNVTIPNSVTSIGTNAFSGCSGLTNVTIPNSVTSIGTGAFGWCSSLSSVTIPSSVKSIESSLFSHCSSLKIVNIPNSVTGIGGEAFAKCTSLTSITIPNSVLIIGRSVFFECTSLTSVDIPNSVEIIGEDAFWNCASLMSITFPSSVTTIGESAFHGCNNLNSVIVQSSTPPSANYNTFTNYTATLLVPTNSVNTYKTTEPWKNFKSIVSLDGGDTPEPQKCEKPIISYVNGQLKMSCATEGVEYVTDIKDVDVKKHYDSTISLTATYYISVYATKEGYENSETANATLCWIDQQPKAEGDINGIANITAKALLIKNNGGQLTVEGAADGEAISVYTVNGMQSGSAISQNGAASIDTNLQAGSIAIVKIGNKSVKIVIK